MRTMVWHCTSLHCDIIVPDRILWSLCQFSRPFRLKFVIPAPAPRHTNNVFYWVSMLVLTRSYVSNAQWEFWQPTLTPTNLEDKTEEKVSQILNWLCFEVDVVKRRFFQIVKYLPANCWPPTTSTLSHCALENINMVTSSHHSWLKNIELQTHSSMIFPRKQMDILTNCSSFNNRTISILFMES